MLIPKNNTPNNHIKHKYDSRTKHKLHPRHTLHQKSISKLYPKLRRHPKYKSHSQYNTSPKSNLYPKLKTLSRHKLYSKPQRTYNLSTKYKSQQTQYTQLEDKTTSANQTQHNIEIKNQTIKTQYTQLIDKMASAYRPRHQTIPTHQIIKNSIRNIVTNHLPTNKNTHTHSQPLKTMPALPNPLATTKTTFKSYQQSNKKKSKLHGYHPMNTHPYHKIPQPHPQHTIWARRIHHLRHNLHPWKKPQPKNKAHPKYGLFLRNIIHPKHKYHQNTIINSIQYITPTLQYDTYPNHKTPLSRTQHTPHPKTKTHSKYRALLTHKLYLKNKIHTKRKYHSKHNPHLKYATQPNPKHYQPHKRYPHSKPNQHSKHKIHLKDNPTVAHGLCHKTNLNPQIKNKWQPCININHLPKDNAHAHTPTHSNTHQNHKPHSNLLNQQKFNPHLQHKPYPKNTTASAYRPRHISNTYQFINNRKPNSITNQMFINNIKSHFTSKQTININILYPKNITTRPISLTT